MALPSEAQFYKMNSFLWNNLLTDVYAASGLGRSTSVGIEIRMAQLIGHAQEARVNHIHELTVAFVQSVFLVVPEKRAGRVETC